MNDSIAKSICTLGVWGATAAILIFANIGMLVPIYVLVIAAAGFSTAAIWNYKISNIFRLREETANLANKKMDDA